MSPRYYPLNSTAKDGDGVGQARGNPEACRGARVEVGDHLDRVLRHAKEVEHSSEAGVVHAPEGVGPINVENIEVLVEYVRILYNRSKV